MWPPRSKHPRKSRLQPADAYAQGSRPERRDRSVWRTREALTAYLNAAHPSDAVTSREVAPMKSTFVDSSTFVALVVRKDRNHRAAKRTLEALAKARTPLITAVVSAARGRSHNPRVGLEHFVRYCQFAR